VTVGRNGGAPKRDRRIAALTAFLLVTAIATGLAAQALAGRAGRTPWEQAPLLLAVLTLASHLIIKMQCGDEIEALEPFEAVLAPTLFVLPGLEAVGLVVLAKALIGVLHRNAPVKVRFNVAQWGAATGCGALVLAALRSGPGLTGRNVAALVLAMFVVAVVNYTAVGIVLALATRRSLRAVFVQLRPVIPVGWVGGSVVNLAFGVLFVSAYLRSPAAVVVMVIPLLVLYWGSRGFATARTDRVRLAGLQAATHALAGPIDPREAVPAFLEEVRRCFEADAVDLLELSPAGPVLHRVAESYSVTPDRGESTAAMLLVAAQEGAVVVDGRHGAFLSREGWRVAAAAPVRTGEKSFGVLCVYNRGGTEGFERGEIVVLGALAAEVAGALDKAALLDAVLEERRQLADIVGNTSDGILTLDECGIVTSWNAGIEQITGYAADAMVGRVPDIVLRPRDDQGEEVELGSWPRGAAGLPTALEVVCADRQSRWLSCSYSELPAHHGRGPQLVVMARDVTKVHELDKLKDDFVAVVSHELRTPLAPIKGWAVTLLQRGDELSPEQRQEGARAILRQADRLHQLILNILEDSRVETDLNAPPVADEVVDVAAAVAKVVEEFGVLAPERAIVLSGTASPVLVAGRAVRVEQVVTNLVANAVKYAPKDQPIEVSVERTPSAVSILVTDHGAGIPPEARERIFQRFERLADTPTQTGTGLGLYIARHLATTMGATLDVTSTPGGGSTFTLRLRAVRRLAAVG
jgi:PAS domain S-box-containing protein